jgi:hypothetical protein
MRSANLSRLLDGQAHDRILTTTAGFDHHFVKPINTKQWTQVLKRVSGKYEEHRVSATGSVAED